MPKKPKLTPTEQRQLNRTNKYKNSLLVRFGIDILDDIPRDLKTPIKHLCSNCKKPFNISPNSALLLSRPYCTKCLSKKPKLKVLSFDPGLNNFAYIGANYKFAGDKLIRLKIKQHGFVKNTIRDLAGGVAQGIKNYIQELTAILDNFHPDIIVIERFQIRGRFMGLTAEAVPIMIGILFYIAEQRNIFYFPVTAASWKNELHRRTQLDLKQLYDIYIPHLTDAFCMGMYKVANQTVYDYLQKHHKKLLVNFKSPKTLKAEAKNNAR